MCIFLDRAQGGPREVVLAEDSLVPVCAPAMAQRLKTPSDLSNECWLYDATWAGDWAVWCSGPNEIALHSGPAFSLYSLAVDEAQSGAGVLMGHGALLSDRIADGRLVALFPAVPSPVSLNLELAPGGVPKTVRHLVDLLMSLVTGQGGAADRPLRADPAQPQGHAPEP